MISPEEIRLRIVETTMRNSGTLSVDAIIFICKKLEMYVFDSDKRDPLPDDAVKEQRPRLRSKAKDTPSNP